jgi:hypothetical protein
MLIRVKDSPNPHNQGFPHAYYPDALGGVLDWLDSHLLSPGCLQHPGLAALQLKLLDKSMRTLAQATVRVNAIADVAVKVSGQQGRPGKADQELRWLLRTMEDLSPQCAVCNRSAQ